MTARVVVVGGGLAGLFTAAEVMAAGIDEVLVVDEASRPGGVVRTICRDGFSLEPAAGTLLLPHPHLTPLLERVAAPVVPAAVEAGTRFVYTGGRMVTLPSSPRAALAPLVSPAAKLRAAAEPFVTTPPSGPDESLDEFLRRRLGDGLGGMLAWVAASGVFAGDPKRLSARSAFPAFPALEDAAGSIVRGAVRRMRDRRPGAGRPTSHLPVGGMTGLADAVSAHLGERHRLAFPVHSIRRDGSGWTVEGRETVSADHVVLAVHPRIAADLVGGDLASVLRRSVSAPVVVVGLGGRSERFAIPSGFGVLTGPDAGTVSLGILFESSYAPDRAPAGNSLVKVIAGGARRPDVVGWDDDHLISEIGGEVATVLGTDVEVGFTEVVRHELGIPQYDVGHGAWLDEVNALVSQTPGLHLTGWGYRGVGVAHLATDAASVARSIAGSPSGE